MSGALAIVLLVARRNTESQSETWKIKSQSGLSAPNVPAMIATVLQVNVDVVIPDNIAIPQSRVMIRSPGLRNSTGKAPSSVRIVLPRT